MILRKVSMDIHSCSRHVCLAGQDAAVGSFLFYFNWKQRDGFGSFLWEENGLCVGRQAASFHYRRRSRASHVQYNIYSTSFSQDGLLANVVTIFIYSTVCIQCIYCIYTVRLRARWRCSEIGTHHLNFVNSTSIMSMYCTVYTVYTVCTVYTVRFRARSFINLNSYHVSVQYCIQYINTVHTVQLMQ